ncbi:MAG: SurA N-terminal domain-containing protein, partial [Paludibacteraceae bacterium]|nr:SurA N-terminal domain-containing protein [Paludibacteraceae bacterium]
MATLQKIRSHGKLLLIIVGLAMLAFIIGDFLSSGSTFFNREPAYVEAAGKSISWSEFDQRVSEAKAYYELERNGGAKLSADDEKQINEWVYQSFLTEATIQQQAEKLGITVTDEELGQIMVQSFPLFKDPNTGQVNPQAVAQLTQLVEAGASNEVEAAYINAYNFYKNTIIGAQMLGEKYRQIVAAELSPNKIEISLDSARNAVMGDYAFVFAGYNTINDKEVSIDEEDVKKLYEERKGDFKAPEPYRTINYVALRYEASEADRQNILDKINDLKAEFDTTENVALFVNDNYSDESYKDIYYSEKTINNHYADFVFHTTESVTPIEEWDNAFMTARVVERNVLLYDTVQISTIPVLAAEADSIYEVIRNASDSVFRATLQEQIKKFNNTTEENYLHRVIACDEGIQRNKSIFDKLFKVGQEEDLFKNDFRDYSMIYRVEDRRAASPYAKLAVLKFNIIPSPATRDDIYNHAQNIATHATKETFADEAQKQGEVVVTTNVGKGDADLNKGMADMTIERRFDGTRNIVKWVYDAKIGDVSKVFDNNEYCIVAVLTDISDGNYQTYNDVADK